MGLLSGIAVSFQFRMLFYNTYEVMEDVSNPGRGG